jgi:gliding motility-associated-like protein
MNNPGDLCVDISGNIYFVDNQNFRIRRIDAITNIITTVAGNGGASYSGGSVPASSAGIHYPNGVAVDATNLYFSLFSKNVVCKVNLASGLLSTIAGNFVNGFGGDGGPATNASLGYPAGLSVNAAGEILVADYNNNRIRKIDAAGKISTVAGNGMAAYSGDGGLATSASLNLPTGVTTDAAGNIYIADRNNYRIRKVNASTGFITTVAGSGNFGYGGDLQSATSPCTKLADPHKVRVDASGNIFIADQSNARIRKVDTNPVIPNNPAISISGNSTAFCSGQNITFNSSIIDGGINPVYQWKVNGVNAGINNPSFSTTLLKNGDSVSCELTVNTSCGIQRVVSNIITTSISNSIVPAIIISTNTTAVCAGNPVLFSASSTNEGLSPAYQWQVNGNNTGANSATFSSSTLANGDVISCILNSSATCAVPASVTSNSIAVNVRPKVTPSIIISASANAICQGGNVVFNAVSTNGGSSPTYQWQVNAINAGTNSGVFSSSILQNGDIISCNLIADTMLNCVTASIVTSAPIVMTVSATPSPVIVIAVSDNNICPGTPVTFTASAQNTGGSSLLQWKLNNNNTGQNSPVYTNSNLANGDRIECILTAPNSGCPALPVTSNAITVSLKSIPVVSLNPSDTIVLEGSQLLLSANVSGAISSFQWSPPGLLVNPLGLSSLTTPLSANTTFSLQVTNTEGCTNTGVAIVKVYKPLLMPTAFTPNNDGLNDVYRIPPNVLLDLGDFSIYNRWGNRIFSTKNITKGWDGKIDGKPTNSGVFIYIISGNSGGKQIFLKGTFVLMR